MATRIEIKYKKNILDTRAQVRLKKLSSDFPKIKEVFLVDVYTINKSFSTEQLKSIASALTNPVVQEYFLSESAIKEGFNYAAEIGFLPGVTDNTGHTAKEIIEDMLRIKFQDDEDVYFSQCTLIKGKISIKEAKKIGDSLANSLIQRIHIKNIEQYAKEDGMDIIVPKVNLENAINVLNVDLNVSDKELIELGKKGIAEENGKRRGPLALDLKSLLAIKKYFGKHKRKPTDIELEALAQTWSEHCKHTIFASQIDEIKDGLYKHYIKRATAEIRRKKGKKDFCVSVFKDNSGAIIFDDKWLITDKVETHNSPSALDPFGGAITGIVGVNRDTIGFGKGALPVINKYGYCFASPFDVEPIYRDKEKKDKMLSPKRILEGVVAGVNAGGNCSGIPTPQGFVYFHERYKGKPLIFVGTVGLIPRKINGQNSCEKKAKPGDKIIMVGGKVGADGIHGATFSSESLSSGSPATAVQIGDPYMQKKFSDAIIKEARAQNLYNSITDNGAGGLSSSIGEMAKEAGGCEVLLEKVPLKYPGLQPWQIWISESQERMSLAVPTEKVDQFMDLMKRRGVDAWVIGEFNDSGKCVVKYNNQTVLDLDLEFMHDGNPEYILKTKWKKPTIKTPKIKKINQKKIFLKLLSSLNNACFNFVSYQYDYEVLGGSRVKPLHGHGQVNSLASVTRPVLHSKKGVVCSQGLYPTYSELDPYNMAGCSIDTAVRNCLSVGGSLDKLALLDNFCWCSSNEPERLGQLKEAARGAYDFAKAFGTPFISGKDSMFNDFKGFDKQGNPIKISVPPTLLISATGVIENTDHCVTLDAKKEGDLIYVLGETKNELAGSEYYRALRIDGGKVPVVDYKTAIKLYRNLEKAIQKKVIASAQSIIWGGLLMALAKTSIGGRLGMKIDLAKLIKSDDVNKDDIALYSETQSRLVVTVSPKNKKIFEKLFINNQTSLIGKIVKNKFIINGLSGKEVINVSINDLENNYKRTFKNF
ncbi:MAG: AIR synthase-related protein [Patescibacteria group bacterium]|jgi:phosphoribosylformylglycinamidine synthase